jgi:DNA-binding transcriptional LysR family regulator
MSLRQMEYLVAVVEDGSFTRAAERLFVSQPALSHQVKALEQSVGGQLLERRQQSIGLTPMGRAFLPHATAAVRAADEARRAARAVGQLEAGELRIGTLHSIALGVVPAAIRAWRLAHPEVSFELHEYVNIDTLADEMRLGVADVAVGPRPRSWDGPIRKLGDEELVVVLAVDDPLLRRGRRKVALEKLADRPWTLYSPDNGLSPVVLEACAAAGFTPRAAVHTHHTATAVQLAAAGLGPALVPENVIEPRFTGAVLRPERPVRRELVAFTRDSPDPLVAAFTDVLAEHAVIDPRRPSILPGRQPERAPVHPLLPL